MTMGLGLALETLKYGTTYSCMVHDIRPRSSQGTPLGGSSDIYLYI